MAADPLLPTLSRSFADVVSGHVPGGVLTSPRREAKSFESILQNAGTIPIKQPGMFRGEPAAFFSKNEIEKLASPFRFTLIGKFSYKRPPMEVIRKFFLSLGLKSLKSVGLMQDNYVAIFINHEEDYSRLLLRSSWYVSGLPMKIFKWSPDFCSNFESPIVPVWVALPGLPLHFFDKTALFNIASAIGNPLRRDEPTVNLSRPTVARLCIDIDVSKEKPSRIWIGDDKEGFWQEIVYENPQQYCGFCMKLGHDLVHCFVKNPALFVKKNNNKKQGKKEEAEMDGGHKEDSNHVAGKDLEYHDKLPKGGDIDGGVEEEGWVMKKSKKWKPKKHQSSGEVAVPYLSSIKNSSVAMVNNSSQGLALTPVNPNFGMHSKASSLCKNGGVSTSAPAQKILPPIFEKDNSIALQKSQAVTFGSHTSLHAYTQQKEGFSDNAKKANSQPLTSAKNKSRKDHVDGTRCVSAEFKIAGRERNLENDFHLSHVNGSSRENILESEKGDVDVSMSKKDLGQPLCETHVNAKQKDLIFTGPHEFSISKNSNELQPAGVLLSQPPKCNDNGAHEIPNTLTIENTKELQAADVFSTQQTECNGQGAHVGVGGICDKIGPEYSKDNTNSNGPIFLDKINGPKIGISITSDGPKVYPPFDSKYLQFLLFNFLADRGYKIRILFRKELEKFFGLLDSHFEESWEISWFFLQKNLFQFLKKSGEPIPQKLRKIINLFFQKATSENWPMTNTKDKSMLEEDDSSGSYECSDSDYDF